MRRRHMFFLMLLGDSSLLFFPKESCTTLWNGPISNNKIFTPGHTCTVHYLACICAHKHLIKKRICTKQIQIFTCVCVCVCVCARAGTRMRHLCMWYSYMDQKQIHTCTRAHTHTHTHRQTHTIPYQDKLHTYHQSTAGKDTSTGCPLPTPPQQQHMYYHSNTAPTNRWPQCSYHRCTLAYRHSHNCPLCCCSSPWWGQGRSCVYTHSLPPCSSCLQEQQWRRL